MLLLDAGIACHQGWTLDEARAQPFEDLLTLAAYKGMEAEWTRRDTGSGPAPNSGGSSGGSTQVTTTEFTLRPRT